MEIVLDSSSALLEIFMRLVLALYYGLLKVLPKWMAVVLPPIPQKCNDVSSFLSSLLFFLACNQTSHSIENQFLKTCVFDF